MKFEFSAGGIVFQDQRSEIKDQNGILILLCQHSFHHGWGFPKGLIGDASTGSLKRDSIHFSGQAGQAKHIKETKEEAALREVEEETGVRAVILEALNPINYWYKFEDEKIKKTVYYFVMKYLSGDIAKHDFEMENVEWIGIDKVLEKLTFKADKKVFLEAMPIIKRLMFNG